jgi:hypothetical protein
MKEGPSNFRFCAAGGTSCIASFLPTGLEVRGLLWDSIEWLTIFPADIQAISWDDDEVYRLSVVLENHYQMLEEALEDRGTYYPQSTRTRALRRTVLERVKARVDFNVLPKPAERNQSKWRASDDLSPTSQEFIKVVENFRKAGSSRTFILTKLDIEDRCGLIIALKSTIQYVFY